MFQVSLTKILKTPNLSSPLIERGYNLAFQKGINYFLIILESSDISEVKHLQIPSSKTLNCPFATRRSFKLVPSSMIAFRVTYWRPTLQALCL